MRRSSAAGRRRVPRRASVPGTGRLCSFFDQTGRRPLGPVYGSAQPYRFTCPCGTEVFGHETFSRYEKFDDLPKEAPLCVAFADARCFRVL